VVFSGPHHEKKASGRGRPLDSVRVAQRLYVLLLRWTKSSRGEEIKAELASDSSYKVGEKGRQKSKAKAPTASLPPS